MKIRRFVRDIKKFEVCICVVEKMNGSDYIRFKDVTLKFDEYAGAIKYAEKMKKNSVRYASEGEAR